MKKIILPLINLSLILIVIVLSAATFYKRLLMRDLFSYGGYYLLLLLVLFWIITILQCLRQHKPDLKAFAKSYGWGIFAALVISIIIFMSVTPLFRVLSDETNLLADSKSMIYEKRTDNITMGMWYYDNFYPINREIPKRPLLFPFLASIIHILCGYHAKNVFVLNFIVLFTILSLVYFFIKNHLGSIWALPAIFLVASQPIIVQNATSGGFDLTAALFLMICFMSLEWFLKKPSALRFQFLWVNLLMVANVRHEGILACLFVVLFLFIFKYIRYGFFKTRMSVIYFSTPLIFLLTFWQRLLVRDPFETTGAPFSAAYFIKNTVTFFKMFFDYRFFFPYASIINLVGFIALLYFIYLFIAKKVMGELWQRHLIIISAAVLAINWVLYASFYNGMIDHPSCSRYYAIFFISLSLFSLFLASRFTIFTKRPEYILMLSILMFVLYQPVSIQDRFSRMQTLPREYRFTMNFLDKEAQKNRGFMVIADRPGQYTVHDYGAVNFDYANHVRGIIDGFNNRLYENIYVIQDIEYATFQPKPATKLNDNFVLETVAEMQNNAEFFTRISKVVSVNGKPRIVEPPKIAEPPKAPELPKNSEAAVPAK